MIRTQQTLPYHHGGDDPEADPVGQPPEDSLGCEEEEIEYLEEGGGVEVAVDGFRVSVFHVRVSVGARRLAHKMSGTCMEVWGSKRLLRKAPTEYG